MTPWQQFIHRWRECQECPLCTQRSSIVIFRGESIPCDVLFIGEAPGVSEDVLGLPFVGPAGKLLDQIVQHSVPVGVSVGFTNLVCCFPAEAKQTDNHEPEDSEIIACAPRLRQQVELLKPKLVVTVGDLATEWVPRLHPALASVARVKITHPAAILRMPLAQKGMVLRKSIVSVRTAIEDLIELRKIEPKEKQA